MPHFNKTRKVATKPPTQRTTTANEENLKTGEVQRASETKDARKLLSLTTMAMQYASKGAKGGNSERYPDKQNSGQEIHASPPHQSFVVTSERGGGAPSSQNKQAGQKPITPSPFLGGGRNMAHFSHQMLPGWAMMGGPVVIHHASDTQGCFASPLRPVPPTSTGSDLEATSLATGMNISPIVKPPAVELYYQQRGDQSEGCSRVSHSPEKQPGKALSRKRTADEGNRQEPPSKKDRHGKKGCDHASPVSVAGHDDKIGGKVTSGKTVISPTPSDSDGKEEHRDQSSSEKACERQAASLVQPFAVPYPYYGQMFGHPGMYPPHFAAGYGPMVVMQPATMYPAQPYHMPPPGPTGLKIKDQFFPPSLDEAAKISDTSTPLPRLTESSEPTAIGDKEKALKPMSKITPVADWQAAARDTGTPPSVGRCVPLHDPVPSHYWGVTDTDAAQNIKLPDFHRLVNFPDYLAKNKMSSRQSGCAPQGKRHCVMCGKLRVCSGAGASAPGPNASGEDTLCIIPRQNKGLCTACDVTIWVVVDQAIEIKWCKGCKNFRPWVAFGDKGSATKCVRCRERQREKYATQKEQLRKRRLRQKLNPIEEEKKEEDQVAAAKGLRNLMSAAL